MQCNVLYVYDLLSSMDAWLIVRGGQTREERQARCKRGAECKDTMCRRRFFFLSICFASLLPADTLGIESPLCVSRSYQEHVVQKRGGNGATEYNLQLTLEWASAVEDDGTRAKWSRLSVSYPSDAGQYKTWYFLVDSRTWHGMAMRVAAA